MDPQLAALMAGQGQPPTEPQQPPAPDFLPLVPAGAGGQYLDRTTGPSLRPSNTMTVAPAANGNNEVRLPYLTIDANGRIRFTKCGHPPGVEIDGNVVHCRDISIRRQPDGSVRIDADDGVHIDPHDGLGGCSMPINGQRFRVGMEVARGGRGRVEFMLGPPPPVMAMMMGLGRGRGRPPW